MNSPILRFFFPEEPFEKIVRIKRTTWLVIASFFASQILLAPPLAFSDTVADSYDNNVSSVIPVIAYAPASAQSSAPALTDAVDTQPVESFMNPSPLSQASPSPSPSSSPIPTPSSSPSSLPSALPFAASRQHTITFDQAPAGWWLPSGKTTVTGGALRLTGTGTDWSATAHPSGYIAASRNPSYSIDFVQQTQYDGLEARFLVGIEGLAQDGSVRQLTLSETGMIQIADANGWRSEWMVPLYTGIEYTADFEFSDGHIKVYVYEKTNPKPETPTFVLDNEDWTDVRFCAWLYKYQAEIREIRMDVNDSPKELYKTSTESFAGPAPYGWQLPAGKADITGGVLRLTGTGTDWSATAWPAWTVAAGRNPDYSIDFVNKTGSSFYLGLEGADASGAYRRLAISETGLIQIADATGWRTVSMSALAANVEYTADFEHLSDRIELYIYRKGTQRTPEPTYALRNADWADVRFRTWLFQGVAEIQEIRAASFGNPPLDPYATEPLDNLPMDWWLAPSLAEVSGGALRLTGTGTNWDATALATDYISANTLPRYSIDFINKTAGSLFTLGLEGLGADGGYRRFTFSENGLLQIADAGSWCAGWVPPLVANVEYTADFEYLSDRLEVYVYQKGAERPFEPAYVLRNPDWTGVRFRAWIYQGQAEIRQISVRDNAPRIYVGFNGAEPNLEIGSNMTVTAVTDPSPADFYQWYLNGTALTGETGPSLTIGSALAAGDHQLTLEVKAGAATNWKTLNFHVWDTLGVFFSGGQSELQYGTGMTITATTFPADADSYQWYLDDVPLSGETNASITIGNGLAARDELYRLALQVTRDAEIAIKTFDFKVWSDISISFSGAQARLALGCDMTVAATTVPSAMDTYQWYLDGMALAGQTGPSVTLGSALAMRNDPYVLELEVSWQGQVARQTFPFDVVGDLGINFSGTKSQLGVGTDMTVTGTLHPPGAHSYQWYLDGVVLVGETHPSITLGSALSERRNAYQLKLEAMLGVNKSVKTFDFLVWDQIDIQLNGAKPVLAAGTSMTVTTAIDPQVADAYQWFLDGSALAGQTRPSITLGETLAARLDPYELRVEVMRGNVVRSKTFEFKVERQNYFEIANTNAANKTIHHIMHYTEYCYYNCYAIPHPTYEYSSILQLRKSSSPGVVGTTEIDEDIALVELNLVPWRQLSLADGKIARVDLVVTASAAVSDPNTIYAITAKDMQTLEDGLFSDAHADYDVASQDIISISYIPSTDPTELIFTVTDAVLNDIRAGKDWSGIFLRAGGNQLPLLNLSNPKLRIYFEPVTVNLSGFQPELKIGTDMMVTAVTDPPAADSYRWLLNGSALTGQTGPSLTLGHTLAAGDYHLTLEATLNGQTTIKTQDFKVWDHLEINLEGAKTSLAVGQDMTVTASTVTPAAETYQWLLNGVVLPGQTGTSVTIGSTLAEGEYQLTLNATREGVVSSQTVEFYVGQPIGIVFSGVLPELGHDENMTVTASTSRSPVDSYQWYLNGEALAGETRPSITLGSALTPGYYQLTLKASIGRMTESKTADFKVTPWNAFVAVANENVVAQTVRKIQTGDFAWHYVYDQYGHASRYPDYRYTTSYAYQSNMSAGWSSRMYGSVVMDAYPQGSYRQHRDIYTDCSLIEFDLSAWQSLNLSTASIRRIEIVVSATASSAGTYAFSVNNMQALEDGLFLNPQADYRVATSSLQTVSVTLDSANPTEIVIPADILLNDLHAGQAWTGILLAPVAQTTHQINFSSPTLRIYYDGPGNLVQPQAFNQAVHKVFPESPALSATGANTNPTGAAGQITLTQTSMQHFSFDYNLLPDETSYVTSTITYGYFQQVAQPHLLLIPNPGHNAPPQDFELQIEDPIGAESYDILYRDSLSDPWKVAVSDYPVSGTGTTSWIDDGSFTGSNPFDLGSRFYTVRVANGSGPFSGFSVPGAWPPETTQPQNLGPSFVMGLKGPAGTQVRVDFVDVNNLKASFFVNLTGLWNNYTFSLTGANLPPGFNLTSIAMVNIVMDRILSHGVYQGTIEISTKGLEYIPLVEPN